MLREILDLRSFVLVVLENPRELLPGEQVDHLYDYWYTVDGSDFHPMSWGFQGAESMEVILEGARLFVAQVFGGQYDPRPIPALQGDPVEHHFSETLGRLEGLALTTLRDNALATMAVRRKNARAIRDAASAAASYLAFGASIMCRFDEPFDGRYTQMPRTGAFLRHLAQLIKLRSERGY